MRTSKDMGTSGGDSRIQDMLRQKFMEIRNKGVSLADLPEVKKEYDKIKEELEEQDGYIERLKLVKERERKAELKENLKGKTDAEQLIIRKKYASDKLKEKLTPSGIVREELEKLYGLQERAEELEGNLDYLYAKYTEEIEQIRKENIFKKIREADL